MCSGLLLVMWALAAEVAPEGPADHDAHLRGHHVGPVRGVSLLHPFQSRRQSWNW